MVKKRFFLLLAALLLITVPAALAGSEPIQVGVTSVAWDGMTVGRCVAPAGFPVGFFSS